MDAWPKILTRRHQLFPLSDDGAYIEEQRFFGKRKRKLVEITPGDDGVAVLALVDGIFAGVMPLIPGTGVTLNVGDTIRLPGGVSFQLTGRRS